VADAILERLPVVVALRVVGSVIVRAARMSTSTDHMPSPVDLSEAPATTCLATERLSVGDPSEIRRASRLVEHIAFAAD